MIQLPFSLRYPFILLEKRKIHILGDKIIQINKGFELLYNEQIVEYFLNHPNVLINISKAPKKSNKYEWTSGYVVFEQYICYYNLLFLLINKNEWLKYKTIFCLHDDKLYCFDVKNLQQNFGFLFSNFNQPLYELAKDLENQEITIYCQSSIKHKIDEKIRIKFKENKFKKIFLQNNLRRLDILEEGFVLTNQGLQDSKRKTPKIETGIDLPVIKLQKIGSKASIHKYFSAYTFTFSDHYRMMKNRANSGGSDLYDKKSAKIKAFAEAIERHHSSYLHEDVAGLRTNFDFHLVNRIVGTKIYNKESQSICKTAFEINSKINDIVLMNTIQIPGELIFYPYIHNNYYFSSSNGVGAGRSYEEALLSGLLELSERDSLMLMWLQKLTPRKIDHSTLPQEFQDYISDIETKYNGKIILLDISFGKTFPHIFGFFKGDNKYEMGASCKINAYDAVEKVISEILNNIDVNEKHTKISINEASEFKDHKRFYTDNENFQYLSFLYKNNEIISYQNLPSLNDVTLGGILQVFIGDVGGRFFMVDLTTTYSRDLGLYVVKVFSENMIPIWFGRKSISQIPYNKNRLYNFPKTHNAMVPDFLHFFD